MNDILNIKVSDFVNQLIPINLEIQIFIWDEIHEEDKLIFTGPIFLSDDIDFCNNYYIDCIIAEDDILKIYAHGGDENE